MDDQLKQRVFLKVILVKKNILSIFGKYRYIHLLIDYMHIVLRKYTLCETKPELLLLSHSVISKSL